MRMRCERLFNYVMLVLVVAACSREKPAATRTASHPTPPPKTAAPVPASSRPDYAGALDWYRSAKSFHYIVDDGKVHAEGDVTRVRPAQEKVTMQTADGEFRAEATKLGIEWHKRNGNQWK